MKQLLLSQGKFALVDDEDYTWLSQWKWHCSNGYAVRNGFREDGRGKKIIWMHREIMKTPDGLFTDHINGDKLNNQRENLRICTKAENMRNRGRTKKNTSGYKGVNPVGNRWRARIELNKKTIHVGYFDTPTEAAQAYDEAIKQYHKEFAKGNNVHP